eukprot:CAMPEP_0202726746 /NCGR_PEP_ID=MMETSP1385-20130828/184770_1 /ASSEMBLY_ACC=CAM_ASM_000861 /TAXON_ID=933848 /ORGANISM="Elphidium margaritaceum" /LENGTH=474 /DNA_ID=CAMNT_0049392973 /DNA_START=42 /DNA_END=1467 /DNA_ORIENTATION=+
MTTSQRKALPQTKGWYLNILQQAQLPAQCPSSILGAIDEFCRSTVGHYLTQPAAIDTVQNLSLNGASFTVELWLYLLKYNTHSQTQNDNNIVGCSYGSNNGWLHINIRNGRPYFGFYFNDDDDDDEDDDDEDDEDDDDEDDDEYMDSDDEEQARRLQELEYKIGHRPPMEELIEKRILYKKAIDMTPVIQNEANNLQHVITKRNTDASDTVKLRCWTHLAFVYDKKKRQQIIYINGERVAVGHNKTALSAENNNVVYFSNYAGGRVLNGVVKNVRMWNSAQGGDEINRWMYTDNHKLARDLYPKLTRLLIEKRILYKKAIDMTPVIQNEANNLQHVITKRNTDASDTVKLRCWTHLAFVYDKKKRQQIIYINGERVAVGHNKTALSAANNNVVYFSNYAGGRVLNGVVKNVRMWNSAQSEKEINSLMYTENHKLARDLYPKLTRLFWTDDYGVQHELIQNKPFKMLTTSEIWTD